MAQRIKREEVKPKLTIKQEGNKAYLHKNRRLLMIVYGKIEEEPFTGCYAYRIYDEKGDYVGTLWDDVL